MKKFTTTMLGVWLVGPGTACHSGSVDLDDDDDGGGGGWIGSDGGSDGDSDGGGDPGDGGGGVTDSGTSSEDGGGSGPDGGGSTDDSGTSDGGGGDGGSTKDTLSTCFDGTIVVRRNDPLACALFGTATVYSASCEAAWLPVWFGEYGRCWATEAGPPVTYEPPVDANPDGTVAVCIEVVGTPYDGETTRCELTSSAGNRKVLVQFDG